MALGAASGAMGFGMSMASGAIAGAFCSDSDDICSNAIKGAAAGGIGELGEQDGGRYSNARNATSNAQSRSGAPPATQYKNSQNFKNQAIAIFNKNLMRGGVFGCVTTLIGGLL